MQTLTTRSFFFLRYYPPEKQGLRQRAMPAYSHWPSPQILSSRKTRIKTQVVILAIELLSPQILSSRKTRIKTPRFPRFSVSVPRLRYYPPEKQGLRPTLSTRIPRNRYSQILSSRKTRIKTSLLADATPATNRLRYYPPEKQGLRLGQLGYRLVE